MPHCFRSLSPILLATALALAAGPSWADKPAHAGGGGHPHADDKHKGKGGDKKHQKHEKHERQDEHRDHRGDDRRSGSRAASGGGVTVNVQIGGYFNDGQRRRVVEYYEPQFRAGKCPPGLAKKRNGCMPPGQAKKWHRGAPLPRDVVYYAVPDAVSIRLGAAPSGHRYVRVATDILLIAIGTGMVVDAIEDLGRL